MSGLDSKKILASFYGLIVGEYLNNISSVKYKNTNIRGSNGVLPFNSFVMLNLANYLIDVGGKWNYKKIIGNYIEFVKINNPIPKNNCFEIFSKVENVKEFEQEYFKTFEQTVPTETTSCNTFISEQAIEKTTNSYIINSVLCRTFIFSVINDKDIRKNLSIKECIITTPGKKSVTLAVLISEMFRMAFLGYNLETILNYIESNIKQLTHVISEIEQIKQCIDMINQLDIIGLEKNPYTPITCALLCSIDEGVFNKFKTYMWWVQIPFLKEISEKLCNI